MFPITITIKDQDQLNAVIAAMTATSIHAPSEKSKSTTDYVERHNAGVSAVEKEAVAAAGKYNASTTPYPPHTADAGDTKAERLSEQPAATPTAAATEAVSYQETATAITKLSRVKGRDTAVALLAKFGAANLKEIKPEQFAAVLAAANDAAGA
jgi:hypothetical protein